MGKLRSKQPSFLTWEKLAQTPGQIHKILNSIMIKNHYHKSARQHAHPQSPKYLVILLPQLYHHQVHFGDG